jgi:hypothetical protein
MIDPWFTAHPILPPPFSYWILIALTFCFIWMEWKKNTPYLSIRVISVTVMMFGVTGFLLRPQYQATRSEQIILLTPDYSKSRADSLLDIYPEFKVVHSQGADAYQNSIPVSSYHELSDQLANITFILGQGLPREALDLFPSYNYQFIPSHYPTGVVRLSPPDNVVQNRTANIEGVFNNPPGKKSKLILTGPGGNEDSLTFSKDGWHSFSLSFLPREAGKFLYTLESENTIIGKLPLNIREEKRLNILFIQHYPTFETRYLKEYLSKSHSLLLRYQLSKNNFRHEYINRKAENINRLTEEALSGFDLVIIDTDALRSLRASEKTSLRSAIEEGLGLLPLFNEPPGRANDFFPFKFKWHISDTAHVSLGVDKQTLLPAWPFEAIAESGMHPILKNRDRTLSAYRNQGFGKIGFQLLQETYRLMLQGDSLAYASLWSTVVENISRSDMKASTVWQQKKNFPLYPDTPAEIQIISSSNEPDVLLDDIKIAIKEDILIDDLWMAKFWTDREGWNHIVIDGDTVLDLYTSHENEWRSLAIAHALESTLHAASSTQTERKLTEAFVPVPSWIFYLLFLVGAGFLWLAPKL